jgi:aryl-alcohol dehydrogenase-like predicted oxidoreductase
MQKRALGKTGEELSIIGFGGIVVSGMEQSPANAIVAEAFDRGINYFDVAPSYGDAEDRLGPALEPYRDRVFLACKTGKRDKEGAAAELRESLRKLRTDHVDLYQLHALAKPEDIEQAFGPGGALEAFVAARQQGLTRFLGFSAHSVEVALDAMRRFAFDSVLFPINYVLYQEANFGHQVVALAKEQGIGRLALKAMARTKWPEATPREARPFQKCWYEPITDPEEASLALRFTLSEPITAAIPPGEPTLFRMALDAAERFQPLTDGERAELSQRAAGLQPIFQLAA